MTSCFPRRLWPTTWLFGLLVCTTIQSGCEKQPSYTTTFLGRTIDLEPYMQGFPYSRVMADYEADKLFYYHQTADGTFLMVQPLKQSGQVAPETGTWLTDIDWSIRNLWGAEYDSVSGDMITLGDERNDEVLNLFRLSLSDGIVTKLTDVPYVYGYGFSKDRGTIGYIARHGSTEPYRTCLVTFDMRTSLQHEVLCEEGSEHRMVWSAVNWRPGGSGIVLKVNKDGHRKLGTLAYLDLDSGEPMLDILLTEGIERFGLGSYEDGWLDNDRFYYSSDESGYNNLVRLRPGKTCITTDHRDRRRGVVHSPRC